MSLTVCGQNVDTKEVYRTQKKAATPKSYDLVNI